MTLSASNFFFYFIKDFIFHILFHIFHILFHRVIKLVEGVVENLQNFEYCFFLPIDEWDELLNSFSLPKKYLEG